MALKLTKKPAQAMVTAEVSSKGMPISETASHEQVAMPPDSAAQAGSLEPWCEVGVEASYTHNLGNYRSARFGVSLRLPCLAAEVDQTFEFGKTWVDARMQDVINELTAEEGEEEDA